MVIDAMPEGKWLKDGVELETLPGGAILLPAGFSWRAVPDEAWQYFWEGSTRPASLIGQVPRRRGRLLRAWAELWR